VALKVETPGELSYPFHTVYRSDTPPGPGASWLMSGWPWSVRKQTAYQDGTRRKRNSFRNEAIARAWREDA